MARGDESGRTENRHAVRSEGLLGESQSVILAVSGELCSQGGNQEALKNARGQRGASACWSCGGITLVRRFELALQPKNRVHGFWVEVCLDSAGVGEPPQWWSCGNVGTIWNGNE